MNPRHPFVTHRAGNHCEYCHAPEVVANFPFEIEHITPVSQHGANDTDNLALACRSCNLFKSDAISAIDPETEEIVSLFHPRRDTWEENFHYDAMSGRIEGISAIGRATVARLQMNSPFQTEARRWWVRLGIFP